MRTGSTLELQIQGARTGAPSRDESDRSLGGSSARRGAGVQLGGNDSRRSGSQQQISPYLSSLSYGTHELLGGRRSNTASGSSASRGLAAGASAAVQEAHQRLERLLGPQQQATGTAGSLKRPISAPLTFGAPIGMSSIGGGTSSSATTSCSPASATASGSGTSSKPRPASANPLHMSVKGTSSGALVGVSAGSASLLSTAPAAMGRSSSAAASNHRVSGRTHSASDPSSGMLGSVGVTGVISSGHNSAGLSASDGNGGSGGAKVRLRSPTGGRSTVMNKDLLGEAVLGTAGALLDGSASMPALLPSGRASSPSVGASGAAVLAAASGRSRSFGGPSSALTMSSSEKVLGTSRLSASSGRSAGASAMRSASHSSTSPKSGAVTVSGSHGSGLGTSGGSKPQPQFRRRSSAGDPLGSSGTAGNSSSCISALGTDGSGLRAAAVAAGATGTGTTTLKVGQVVDTGRAAVGASSGGSGAGLRSGTGQAHRSGGGSYGSSSESCRVRTPATGGERHSLGPRSPSSLAGPAVGTAVAKTITGRASTGGAGGVGARTAAPASGTKTTSGRRASSGLDEAGAPTAASTALVGESALNSTAATKASGAATGGGSTGSSNSSHRNSSGGAAVRPSSSERRRRSSTTNTNGPSRLNVEAGPPAGVGSGQSWGSGALREAPARQPSATSLPVPGGAAPGASGTLAQCNTGQAASNRIKPPSIDLTALSSVSGASENASVLSRHATLGGTDPGKANSAASGRRVVVAEFSLPLEVRIGPPVLPGPAGSPPGGGGRFHSPPLDESTAPSPLLLVPSRSPLQSPRSSLGLPRRIRAGLGSGSGGVLLSSGGGLPAACRWARNPPLPLPVDSSEALSPVISGVMAPSAVVMHDLQAVAHGLVLQVGAGSSSFIENLRERYVEVYRAGRKAQQG